MNAVRKPIHFAIFLQGTPGKGLLAVVRDRDFPCETQADARTLKQLLVLCQSAIEERLRATEEKR